MIVADQDQDKDHDQALGKDNGVETLKMVFERLGCDDLLVLDDWGERIRNVVWVGDVVRDRLYMQTESESTSGSGTHDMDKVKGWRKKSSTPRKGKDVFVLDGERVGDVVRALIVNGRERAWVVRRLGGGPDACDGSCDGFVGFVGIHPSGGHGMSTCCCGYAFVGYVSLVDVVASLLSSI